MNHIKASTYHEYKEVISSSNYLVFVTDLWDTQYYVYFTDEIEGLGRLSKLSQVTTLGSSRAVLEPRSADLLAIHHFYLKTQNIEQKKEERII